MTNIKLLVVDDEKPIQAYLQRKFDKLGFLVSVATDGEEALERAFSELPDIVLLDVKLPKMDGLQVVKRLRANPKTARTPILILSAKAQAEEIQEGLSAGADKYLCKPISFPELLSEIQAFVQKRGER